MKAVRGLGAETLANAQKSFGERYGEYSDSRTPEWQKAAMYAAKCLLASRRPYAVPAARALAETVTAGVPDMERVAAVLKTVTDASEKEIEGPQEIKDAVSALRRIGNAFAGQSGTKISAG